MSIIVTGAGGMLGRAVFQALMARFNEPGFESIVAMVHEDLDIRSQSDVSNLVTKEDLVINCAGIVPGAEKNDEEMVSVNADGPHLLAKHARRVVQVSTDYVFDGQEGPYSENSKPTPRGNYAVTKLAGELTQAPHLTVRASFVGFGKYGLLAWLLDHPEGAEVPGYTNWFWNGFYVLTFAGFSWTRHWVRGRDFSIFIPAISLRNMPFWTGLLKLSGPISMSKLSCHHSGTWC